MRNGETIETRIGPLTLVETRRVSSGCYSILTDADGVEYLARHKPGKRITRTNAIVERD